MIVVAVAVRTAIGIFVALDAGVVVRAERGGGEPGAIVVDDALHAPAPFAVRGRGGIGALRVRGALDAPMSGAADRRLRVGAIAGGEALDAGPHGGVALRCPRRCALRVGGARVDAGILEADLARVALGVDEALATSPRRDVTDGPVGGAIGVVDTGRAYPELGVAQRLASIAAVGVVDALDAGRSGDVAELCVTLLTIGGGVAAGQAFMAERVAEVADIAVGVGPALLARAEEADGGGGGAVGPREALDTAEGGVAELIGTAAGADVGGASADAGSASAHRPAPDAGSSAPLRCSAVRGASSSSLARRPTLLRGAAVRGAAGAGVVAAAQEDDRE